MTDEDWLVNQTYPDRYRLTGITDHVIKYATQTGKKNLVIIDVGCSTAINDRQLKNELVELGMQVHTIGVDPLHSVRRQAVNNLDEFINANIDEVHDRDETADVVICSKMAVYVPYTRRSEIISKCAKLLKNDGALVTDVDHYENISFLEDLKHIPYHLGGLFLFSMRISNIPFAKKTRIICGREAVLKYSNRIIKGWEKLEPHKKSYVNFTMHAMRAISILVR